MSTTTMERSYLIQRLRKPFGRNAWGMKDNPFSFGGGLKNGGLSDEAMDLLRGIFSFDYMGSAEFEFGAVPEALQRIAKSDDLVAFTIPITLALVPPHWKDKGPAPEGTATVYVLCREAHREEVFSRIVALATQEGYDKPWPMKEIPQFTFALRPYEWENDNFGWLELNNGYFFFIDREMWEKTCALFQVTPE